MKLQVMKLGFALAILWAAIVFLVGLGNLLFPAYGVAFLELVASIYPGYTFGLWGIGGVLVATGYALLDGFVVGIVFAALYNAFVKTK